MLNLRIEDKNPHLKEELNAVMEENKAIFRSVLAGENKYMNSLGWFSVKKWAGIEYIKELQRLAFHIREKADVFVIVGVGGSNNAARAVIEALQTDDKVKIVYMGNTLSPYELKKSLKGLEGKSVYIDCVAKNFETLEPGASFRILRSFLSSKYQEEAKERIIVTGTKGSLLEKLCEEQGYTFLEFPEDIGGRFSAMTSVGLLPMAVAGLDIEKLVLGASDMQKKLINTEMMQNPAYQYAVLRNFYYKKGYKIEMLVSFEPQFRGFYKWWTQLFGESEGKAGKGIFPTTGDFCEELHSMGQYIQDGMSILFETFLDVQEKNAILSPTEDTIEDGFEYLNGKEFWEINKASFYATVKAHKEKLPCLILELERLDEYNFGELFYFFMFSCYLSSRILGVNPFDQPGVEAYKKCMFEALGKV